MNSFNDDMSLINRYTRKELSEDDVYIFNITLCDNDVDRDFECFSKDALEELAKLFEGKTGIFDHDMKASGQNARIFKTWVETQENRKTSFGAPYCRLRAKAYMVKTQENKALIDEIDGGIKKEVSIGCSVKNSVCSICLKNMRTGECEHRKGRTYGAKQCYAILSQPYDAYEWSFVAVPAQREAGVTKSFEDFSKSDTLKLIKSAQSEAVISFEELEKLKAYLDLFEKYKGEAELFRNELLEKIKKAALITMPLASCDTFLSACANLETKKLVEFSKDLQSQADLMTVPTLQLKPLTQGENTDNTAYRI